MNCSHCGKPIVLTPPATERANKYGGKPSDYTNLFTIHADCQIEKRSQSSRDLMEKIKNNPKGIYRII